MIHAERFHFARITSTNDYAKTLLKDHQCVAVTADEQTAGRGRHNRSWAGEHSANVYCSLGVRHRHTPQYETLIALQGLGCLGALYALRQIAPTVSFFLKYPNDVYALEDNTPKKIAGVLVENDFVGAHCTMSIIGVGINVLQQEFPDTLRTKATSLVHLHTHTPQDAPARLADRLITYIEEQYATPPTIIMQVWQRELCAHGLRYMIVGDDTATIYTPEMLLPTGHLQLRSAEGMKQMVSQGDSLVVV
jgi:biotin-[acetyl-CoA-carboxylase] ligase BirA-like protein